MFFRHFNESAYYGAKKVRAKNAPDALWQGSTHYIFCRDFISFEKKGKSSLTYIRFDEDFIAQINNSYGFFSNR